MRSLKWKCQEAALLEQMDSLHLPFFQKQHPQQWLLKNAMSLKIMILTMFYFVLDKVRRFGAHILLGNAVDEKRRTPLDYWMLAIWSHNIWLSCRYQKLDFRLLA